MEDGVTGRQEVLIFVLLSLMTGFAKAEIVITQPPNLVEIIVRENCQDTFHAMKRIITVFTEIVQSGTPKTDGILYA